MNGRPPGDTPRAHSRFAPWAGLVAAFLGAMVQHQGIGDALHFRCGPGMGRADVIAGVVAVIVMAAGGAISWSALRADRSEPGTRRFVAQLSLMAVALFMLMVVWQTLAGLIVPSCP
jgi:hypothetical protein